MAQSNDQTNASSGKAVPSTTIMPVLPDKRFYDYEQYERASLLLGPKITIIFDADSQTPFSVPHIPKALLNHYSHWARREFATTNSSYVQNSQQFPDEEILTVPSSAGPGPGGKHIITWLMNLAIVKQNYTCPHLETFASTVDIYRLVKFLEIGIPTVRLGQVLKDDMISDERMFKPTDRRCFTPDEIDGIVNGLSKDDGIRIQLLDTMVFHRHKVFDPQDKAVWQDYFRRNPAFETEVKHLGWRNW